MFERSPRIIFAEKAYLSIIVETYERIKTETGGILLGKRQGNDWYILEGIDPGPNSIFQASYFEYDTAYVNHLANKVSRFYKEPLELIGLWHRHPGSLDQFSLTDDATNKKYTSQHPSGAISGLVNLDPNFRLTMYYVPPSRSVSSRPKYSRINYEIGNDQIPSRLFEMKQVNDYISANSTRRRSSNDRSPSHRKYGNYNLNFFKDSSREPDSSANSTYSLENLLAIIEPEIDYLEAQNEYECQMKADQNQLKVLVTMEYRGEIREYPPSLRYAFYLNQHNEPMVQIDRNPPQPYQQGIICGSIDQFIRQFYQ